MAARVLGRVIDASAAIGGRLPARVAHRLAVIGGNIEWALRPRTRRRLAENLAHAVRGSANDKRVRTLVRRELVNEARRSADLLWAISRPDEFLSSVDVSGIEHVHDAAHRGRGVLLAGIHVGGWEVATALPGKIIPVPTTVVVADNWLAWAIEHVRLGVGLRIMYRSGALGAVKVLQRGEALLVFGDDAFGATPRLYEVKFCGSHARLPAGNVVLARMTGAAIVPFEVLPLAPRKWHVQFGEAIAAPPHDGDAESERLVLQALADHWTEVLSRVPDHWAARFAIAWTDTP